MINASQTARPAISLPGLSVVAPPEGGGEGLLAAGYRTADDAKPPAAPLAFTAPRLVSLSARRAAAA